jgi:hypothetical protein
MIEQLSDRSLGGVGSSLTKGESEVSKDSSQIGFAKGQMILYT